MKKKMITWHWLEGNEYFVTLDRVNGFICQLYISLVLILSMGQQGTYLTLFLYMLDWKRLLDPSSFVPRKCRTCACMTQCTIPENDQRHHAST